MTNLSEYFLSNDLDIIRFTVWHLVYFAVLTGSWIPLWRQSERREPRRANGNKVVQHVVVYGYQTRKRREKEAGLYARWVLMNPDYFYNSFVWTILMLSAAAGCYYAQTNSEQSDLRSIGLWIAGFQASLFGAWTIAPFYWDMPGWGILHLAVASTLSIAVSWIYAYLTWWAFGLYTVYTLAQVLLTLIYSVAFLIVLSDNRIDGRHFTISNPLRAMFLQGGLHPISFLERDLFMRTPAKGKHTV